MNPRAAIAALLVLAGCSEGHRLKPTKSALQVSPAVLDFGPQESGSAVTLTLSFANSGSAPLSFATRFERDARGAFSMGGAPTEVAPGSELELAVTYLAPEVEGADGVSLVIESDSLTTAQLIVSIAGRSIAPAVEPSPIDAGPQVAEVDAGMPEAPWSCPGAPPALPIGASGRWPELPRLAWNGSSNLLTRVVSPSTGTFALEVGTFSQGGVASAPSRLLPGAMDARAVFTGAGYGLLASRWIGSTGAEVVFAQLTVAGVLVPSSERVLPRIRDFQTDAALAWNPAAREWGVLWHEWDNGAEVQLRLARLTESGALIEAIELGPGLIEGSGSMLAWAGGAFATLVRLGTPERLSLIRVDAAGVVSMTEVAAGARFHAQNVAWNAGGYGLSWVETLGGTARVKFVRASSTGALIAGSERTLHSFPALEVPTADLVASGSGWLATWAGTPAGPGGDIFVARLDAMGERADGSIIQLTCESGRDAFPVASSGGRPTAVAFTRFGSNGPEVRTALIP